MVFRRTFSGMEVRLTNLPFPKSFLTYFKIGVTFAFFQSFGTSHNHHDLSKVIVSGLTMTSTLSTFE